jgi:holliday junction DNA helicase RuvA
VICRIQGQLVAVRDGTAELRVDNLTYEVLVPAADSMLLATRVGEEVEFHTLHYLEGQGQGSSFWPRLIGFRSPMDRDFFELFTTVKGIGNRRALRALQLPFARVAEAIAMRDHGTLQSLPEIGRRTAEAICVELKGKVDRFVMHAAMGGGAGGATGANGAGNAAAARAEPKPVKKRGKAGAADTVASGAVAAGAAPREQATGAADVILMANSAVEVLVQLGHTRLTARDLIERALMARETPPTSAGELVTEALQ